MSPDAPAGIRLSQEQIRIVELAIKEAILEEVDGRIASAEKGKDELAGRLAQVDEALERVDKASQRAQAPAPPVATTSPVTISKVPSPKFLAAVGAGVVAVTASLVFLLVPGRVNQAVDERSADVASMATAIEVASENISADAAQTDSLTRLIAARAEELQLTAGSSAFRAEVADRLKSDSEFLRLSAGPPGPQGPAANAPAGLRYGPGVAYFEVGGVALASMGRSSEGNGHGQFNNRAGGRVAYVGATGGGDGLLRVNSSRDQAAVDIRTGADSTALTMQNGSAMAYLATPTRGTAQLTVANSGGDGGVTLRSRDGLGAILVNGRSAHDLAEVFDLAGRTGVEPGSVMSAVNDWGELGISEGAYDRRVVGVISGAGGYVPGMVLGTRADGSSDLPVAINGQVFVKANLGGGPIKPGDLLVASDEPGTAMRGADDGRLTGAVIGKAMEVFGAGDPDGLVKMLVMPR